MSNVCCFPWINSNRQYNKRRRMNPSRAHAMQCCRGYTVHHHDLAAAPPFRTTSLQTLLKPAAMFAAFCCAVAVFKTCFKRSVYCAFSETRLLILVVFQIASPQFFTEPCPELFNWVQIRAAQWDLPERHRMSVVCCPCLLRVQKVLTDIDAKSTNIDAKSTPRTPPK